VYVKVDKNYIVYNIAIYISTKRNKIIAEISMNYTLRSMFLWKISSFSDKDYITILLPFR